MENQRSSIQLAVDEVDSAFAEVDSMLHDLQIQCLLGFYPTNSGEAFKSVMNEEPRKVTLNSSSSYEEALDANQNSIDCKKLESNTSNTSNIALVNTPLGAVHSQSISSCSSTSINGDPFTRPNSDSFSFGDASTVALSDSVDSEQYRSSGDNSEHESSPDFRDTPQFGDKNLLDVIYTEISGTMKQFTVWIGMQCDRLLFDKIDNCALHPSVSIRYYYKDRPMEIEIRKKWTAKELCFEITQVNKLPENPDWSLFECFPDLHLERHVEDHEIAFQVVSSSWNVNSKNQIHFRNFSRKFDFFINPSAYLPSYILEKEEPEMMISPKAAKVRRKLLERYLTSSDKVPELESFLHVKDYHKKSWSRKYFFLRGSGIYYSGKRKSKSSKDLACNIEFDSRRLYTTSSTFKKAHKAPTEHTFCFVPNEVTELKEIKCFCAEDEQTMLSWIMGYRLAKYGSQLREDYRRTVEQSNRSSFCPNNFDMKRIDLPGYDTARKRPSVDHRVTIDFSGHESRVISDPDEANAVKHLLSVEIPKKLKRRSTGSYNYFPYSAGGPSPVDKPWFHGKLEREESAKRLRTAGLEEGMFLVRESCTSSGVYVLSVVKSNKVIHSQIFRAIGEDGHETFYGLESGPRFQSLDMLIEFYQNYRHAGKPSLLRKPCRRPEKLT